MRQQQHGFLMMTTIVIIVLLSVLAATVVHIFSGQMAITADNSSASQALYLAEAGLEKGKHALLTSNSSYQLACSTITDDSSMTNISMGQGLMTVTATEYPTGSTTTLSSNISAVDTTIPVAGTSNYAPKGYIQIDSEWIAYGATAASSFTNTTRGALSTTAAAHSSGASINQNQCSLNSQTGVPDFSSTSAKRNLREQILMGGDNTFAAGEKTSSDENIDGWNGASWSQLGPYAAIPHINFNGLYMSSATDGWSVGNNSGGDAVFAYWNGSAWSRVLPAASVPSTNLYAITCTASNNCKAVGAKSGGKATIAHWDGSTWSQASDDGSLADEDLVAINCLNANDCWSVGNNLNGDAFFARWGGTQWTRETAALETSGSGTVPNENLTGISCVASNDCWAVGYRVGGPGLANNSPLFLHWDGSQWSRSIAFSTSGPTEIPKEHLNGVYCVASNDCWAVGNADTNALFAYWNGAQWNRIDAGTVPNSNLNAIHCSATDSCWSVGDNSSGEVTAFWNGTVWTRVGPSATVPDKDLYTVFTTTGTSTPQTVDFWEELFT